MNHNLKIDRFIGIVPIIILLIAIILEVLIYSNTKNESLQQLRISFTENSLRFMFTIYGGLLIALNFFKIQFSERKNRETYSEYHMANLNWSRVSLLFYFLFYIGMIISELSTSFISELIFNISILALTLYLGYYQIKVISRYLLSSNQSIEQEKAKALIPSSATLDEDKLSSLFQKLDSIVDDEKLYLKTDLTIHELGVRFNLNSKYLSQAINRQDDLNFNKFINQKRIEHSKVLLLDDRYSKFSIEGIAQESGFRSKSTFNTTFKLETGITPSEFRKKATNS